MKYKVLYIQVRVLDNIHVKNDCIVRGLKVKNYENDIDTVIGLSREKLELHSNRVL